MVQERPFYHRFPRPEFSHSVVAAFCARSSLTLDDDVLADIYNLNKIIQKATSTFKFPENHISWWFWFEKMHQFCYDADVIGFPAYYYLKGGYKGRDLEKNSKIEPFVTWLIWDIKLV